MVLPVTNENGMNNVTLPEDVRYLDRDIETSTVGYFIEEDDKAIVLASIR